MLGTINRRKRSVDLSNYSARDLIQEWILDRARAPLLLKKAVELEGIEGVLALAKEHGVAPSTMRLYLMKAGCIATEPKPKPEDPFRDKVEKLWRRDRARFMDIVEGLWSTNGL